mmetsp:Transcript_25208/g.72588  ORF Transcript_25208/g.72588 Transcript_25208/m.72588 type:complete len:294 (+) Transcript_25208:178-1059(+)|eukprot:CAMPEP_0176054746 /NCGR_PEP_ID=MMETSP0120_2-20121206/27243_1 /TAXON_ID=160619 /ORGANISM="Kryptoperidinium foliaceum, Strain CCMP 1326" /LENGTH=293 /DNA_ID=CAMNT_0017388219 /DNA_START=178 /DNA_END=1059 /DNA_ORIENTATION=+
MRRSLSNLGIVCLFWFPQVLCFVGIGQTPSVLTALSASNDKITVAVTREEGKNRKLIEKIQADDVLRECVDILELPCIEHATGPDYDKLAPTLAEESFDYVAVTSPESAKVLASAWDAVIGNPIAVVAVGKATEKVLEKAGIPVSFVPSKATAVFLAKELEMKGEGCSLLYPASARAKQTLQDGLEARGFRVKRLNTYDTVTAKWSESQKEEAKSVQIACFASPSSIKGWLMNTGENKDVFAACIGETSANACRGHSWDEKKIFYPDAPGIDEWVGAIRESATALKDSHVGSS